jgi:hypothetical protein
MLFIHKGYYILFTNRHLNTDQLTRFMVLHYFVPWYYLYLVKMHVSFVTNLEIVIVEKMFMKISQVLIFLDFMMRFSKNFKTLDIELISFSFTFFTITLHLQQLVTIFLKDEIFLN